MPRTGRGGRRSGKPGKAYGNRTDLHGSRPAIAEYRGQGYGERKEQVDAQRAVPVAPPPTSSVPGAAEAAATAPQGPAPGTLGDLLGPSARPNEPLSHGMPFGPGPGPGALPMANLNDDPELAALRAIYRANPSRALRELIEAAES